MKYEPIRASVSQETISKVTHLFNGTLPDILNELLQNARRAGASAVEVDATPHGNGLQITIADDGCGIDDPARVIALGASGWDEHIARNETPAGMGVFSLAGKTTMIESCAAPLAGWKICIADDAWTGEKDIAVHPSKRVRGTSITFVMPDVHDASLEYALNEAAKFYPLAVRYRGKERERQDFLEKAIHIENWNGSRIGVFAGSSYREPTVNFHGLTLFDKLIELSQLGRSPLTARIDVGDTPELQLVLPARKEFVKNVGHADLLKACERACYRAIAGQDTHSLTFEQYQRGLELGIDLGEAEAVLAAWEPGTADAEESAPSGEATPITGDEFLMGNDVPCFDQTVARALKGHPIREKLVERHPAYEGYSWYDALREVRDPGFIIEIDGVCNNAEDLPSSEDLEAINKADRIWFVFSIDEQGKTQGERERIKTDLALVYPEGSSFDGLDDVLIAYVPDATLTPDSFVQILDDACFSAWNDSDADSWDTQHERFLRDARELAYRTLEGEDAALASQFRDALARVVYLLPEGKRIDISYTKGAAIDVAITDQAAKP